MQLRGSDLPHFKLDLKHSYKQGKQQFEHTSSLCWQLWTEQKADGSHLRVPNRYPDHRLKTPATFSAQIAELALSTKDSYPADVLQKVPWQPTAGTVPVHMRWLCHQRATGVALLQDPTLRGIHASSQKLFNLLHDVATADTIDLFLRGHHRFLESFSFFAAQPVPTPPPWWRYSTNTTPNQRCIDTLPPLGDGEELNRHLETIETKIENNVSVEKKIIVPYPAMHTFLEERSYQTFIIGLLLREKEAAEKRYDKVWNHKYAFTLTEPEDIMQGAQSSRTFIVILTLTPAYHSEREYDLPDVNSDVFIKDTYNGEEYSGRVIAVGDDNVFAMSVHSTARSGGQILNERYGYFKVGQSTAAFVQAKKNVERAIVNNTIGGRKGATKRNWLKPILLGNGNYRIGVPRLPPPNIPSLSKFLPLNKLQMKALERANHYRKESADRMQIINTERHAFHGRGHDSMRRLRNHAFGFASDLGGSP